ncbi:MAG: hypothetical protein ACFFD4_22175 [Candidatus Odinarchaeota archaeon]
MEYKATYAHVVKIGESLKISDNLWKIIKSDQGTESGPGPVEAMLLVCSKEMKQLFLFPIKNKNYKIVKILCELEELTPSFVQDITEEISDFEMEKVHVTGVTTNEEGLLVFEGYYSCETIDTGQLEKNISSHPTVTTCVVEIVK